MLSEVLSMQIICRMGKDMELLVLMMSSHSLFPITGHASKFNLSIISPFGPVYLNRIYIILNL